MKFSASYWMVVAAIAVFAFAHSAAADEPRELGSQQPGDGRQVELFQAMEDGEVEVRLIPRDSTQATVLLRNKTDQPLQIKLPEAFAGVPVHRQFDMGMGGMGMDGGMGRRGGGGAGGGMQAMGGGMGMGMGGMGMGGMGGMGMGGMGMGGMFNLAPEKVERLRVATVCLEHGKRDPHPRTPYRMVPIEMVTDDPEVVAICRMVSSEQLPQNVGQAAVWHLIEGLGWDELAAQDRVRLSNGYFEKYFTPQELQYAFQAVQLVRQAVREKDDSQSSSEQKYGSLSSR